jgi:hypothetical protein
MAVRRFFVTGDEWALVDIVPAENRAQFERVRQEFAAHHRDTVFSPMGWATPPFLLPGPKVPLAIRGIPLARLEAAFARVLEAADLVETCEDFTGRPFAAPGCYAFAARSEFSQADYGPQAGVYGNAADEVVQTMHLADVRMDAAIADRVSTALAGLGATHSLLLVAHGSWLIDLADRARVAAYLAHDPGAAEPGAAPDAGRGSG